MVGKGTGPLFLPKGLVIDFDANDLLLAPETTGPVKYTTAFPVVSPISNRPSFTKSEQWQYERERRSLR
jgi:hypothetical protein